jgi:hypothetical protein
MKLLLIATFASAILGTGLHVIMQVAVNLKLPDRDQISWTRFGNVVSPWRLSCLYEKLYPDSGLAIIFRLSWIATLILGLALAASVLMAR